MTFFFFFVDIFFSGKCDNILLSMAFAESPVDLAPLFKQKKKKDVTKSIFQFDEKWGSTLAK